MMPAAVDVHMAALLTSGSEYDSDCGCGYSRGKLDKGEGERVVAVGAKQVVFDGAQQ